MDLAVLADHRVKLKETEKNKFLDLARKLKKLWNMKVTLTPAVIGVLGRHQRIGTGTGGLRDTRTSGDHQNNSIAEIS